MKIVVKPNQTLLDVCIQHLGNEEQVYELAMLNGLGFTSTIEAGDELELPEPKNKRAVRAILENGNVPATTLQEALEGIDYWAIELEFIIL